MHIPCGPVQGVASPSGASDRSGADEVQSQNLLTPVLTPPVTGGNVNGLAGMAARDGNDHQPTASVDVNPFSVEDSPRRRRNLRRPPVLGSLGSPTPGSDMEHGLTSDGFLHPGNPQQQRNRLDPRYACRTAHPGTLLTTATHSPFPQQLQTTASVAASPPLTAEQPNRGHSTNSTPELMGYKFSDAPTDDKFQTHRAGSERVRRRSSTQQQARRRRQRPRQRSIDPAGRDIPLRGKVIFTYAMTIASISLVIQSLIIGGGIVPLKENPMLGPSAESLINMGGLVTQIIREGEWWRLVWAPFLHAGIFHVILNLALWLPMGKLVEPDWGVLRTLAIFEGGALTGNLMSAVLDPFSVSVGSSGGIFGIMAGFVPYVIEFWHSIPRAKCLLVLVFLTLVLGIATSFMPYVDIYAHLGGVIGGLLVGFATITKWQAFTEPKRTDRYRYPEFRSNKRPGSRKKSLTKLTSAAFGQTKGNNLDGTAANNTQNSNSSENGLQDHGIGGQSKDVSGTSGDITDQSDAGIHGTNHGDGGRASDSENLRGDLERGDSGTIGRVRGNGSEGCSGSGGGEAMETPPPARSSSKTAAGAGEQGGRTLSGDTSGHGGGMGRRASFADVETEGSDEDWQAWAKSQERDRGRRAGFRATLDPVNDHYGCTAKIWLVRALAILALVATWAPLIYFLFICPECYTAPGQIVTLNDRRVLDTLPGIMPVNGTRKLWHSSFDGFEGNGLRFVVKSGRILHDRGRYAAARISHYEDELRAHLLLLKEFYRSQ